MHSRNRLLSSIRENEKGGRVFILASIKTLQKIAIIHKSRYQDRVCVVFTFVKSWLISMQHSFIEPISHMKHVVGTRADRFSASFGKNSDIYLFSHLFSHKVCFWDNRQSFNIQYLKDLLYRCIVSNILTIDREVTRVCDVFFGTILKSLVLLVLRSFPFE